MKNSVMFFVALTTMLLVMVTILAALEVSIGWIFWSTCFGQFMVAVMVYKVLKDDYSTNKTFNDFYEDNPTAND
jgi:hypothetical protein